MAMGQAASSLLPLGLPGFLGVRPRGPRRTGCPRLGHSIAKLRVLFLSLVNPILSSKCRHCRDPSCTEQGTVASCPLPSSNFHTRGQW